jgi:glycosyltransferase involved in cell wall biosynthesis
MKRIVILIQDATTPNGTERAVSNLASLLIKYGGYQVDILSLFSTNKLPAYFFEKNEKINFMFTKASRKNIVHKFISCFILWFRLSGYLKENRDVHCIISTEYKLSFIAFLTRLNNTKLIACEHLDYMMRPFPVRLLKRLYYPFVNYIVVLTNADKKLYTYLADNKIKVIPNSLSFMTDIVSDCMEKQIISVGRLVYQKGFDMLITAAVKIKEYAPDWHINIFGSGEDKNDLLNMISNKNLEDYISIYEPTKDIIQEYLNSSIYVMSSRFEGLPMVLIEAQSCGLPIISFNCPQGPSEVIDDKVDGLLIEPNNIEAFSDAVIAIIKDENMRKQFGKMAKINSDKYSPYNIYLLWNTLLNIN